MICTLHTSMQDLKLYGADDAVASQTHVSLMLLFLTAGNKQYNTGTVFTHTSSIILSNTKFFILRGKVRKSHTSLQCSTLIDSEEIYIFSSNFNHTQIKIFLIYLIVKMTIFQRFNDFMRV